MSPSMAAVAWRGTQRGSSHMAGHPAWGQRCGGPACQPTPSPCPTVMWGSDRFPLLSAVQHARLLCCWHPEKRVGNFHGDCGLPASLLPVSFAFCFTPGPWWGQRLGWRLTQGH